MARTKLRRCRHGGCRILTAGELCEAHAREQATDTAAAARAAQFQQRRAELAALRVVAAVPVLPHHQPNFSEDV
jgi:hypothetical protein